MNNNQDLQKPIIPFKPQIENNQEELIAKAEEIIAPKKSKVKIILTTLVAFLLLGSVAGAVFLVRQNQDVRKQAAGCLPGCCGDPCGGCPAGQDCDIPNGACDSGKSCNPQGSGFHLDCVGNQCVNVPGTGANNCTSHDQCQTSEPTPTPTPASRSCVAEHNTCSDTNLCCSPLVCHNTICTSCGNIKDEGICWTHKDCHWESGSCKDGATPSAGAGNCKIDCGADEGGVSVTASSGSETACAGATVTAVYYSKSCDGSSGGCAGQTTTQTGGLPFSANRTGPACGSWQSDITASTSKGGTCQAADRGLLPCATPTPTTAISCQCDQIKAYDTSWKLLTSADLAALKAGDKVRFAVSGTTTSGTIDKSRFKINGATYKESAVKKTGTQEYYYEYTIPAGVTSFTVEAQIHHAGLNQWF